MSVTGSESTRHHLLLSVPDLGDENFDRAVVFMVEHNQEGAMGLMLNRPSSTTVGEHLDSLPADVCAPSVFFVGGPVEVGGIVALGLRSLAGELHNAEVVSGPIVAVEADSLINGDVAGVDSVRLFTGYSGWGPGQLEYELGQGVWHIAEALPDDVFCGDPGALWRSVMRRQGGRLSSIGLYPDDPAVN